MEDKNWFKKFARDFVALGSPVFFVLVLARVSMLSKPYYLSQFIIAGVIFFLLMILFKSDLYSGLGFVVLVFTSLYYNDLKFSIVAILIYFGLIASLIYLKTEKNKVIKGILFGAIGTAISYYLVGRIFG